MEGNPNGGSVCCGNGYPCLEGGQALAVGALWLPLEGTALGFLWTVCSVTGLLLTMGQLCFRHISFPEHSGIPHMQVVCEVYLLGWCQQLNLPFKQ